MDSRDLVATLCLTAPHRLEWRLSQALALQPNQVRLRTLFSGISAGTELIPNCVNQSCILTD
jgi:hypothetical protein